MGAVGLDFLAQVDAFPLPDSKVRTRSATHQGGGNAANTAVALARLGCRSVVVGIVGDDSQGQQLRDELRAEGVDDALLTSAPGSSPFTYVIVDRAHATRTCVHTPGGCGELQPVAVAQLLVDRGVFQRQPDPTKRVVLVHFDSRQTAAAVVVATQAAASGVAMSIDIEKHRPGTDALLPLMDFVFTNASFPSLDSPEEAEGSAVPHLWQQHAAMLARYPKARFVCSTLGAGGAVLTRRQGTNLTLGAGANPRLPSEPTDPTRQAQAAAATDTSATAAATAATSLAGALDVERWSGEHSGVEIEVVQVSAWTIDPANVVDTTGAGDAFIGGVLLGLLEGLAVECALALGSRVASCKLRGLGSRTKLPYRNDPAVLGLLAPNPTPPAVPC